MSLPSKLEDVRVVARRDSLEARIIAKTTTRADVDWLVESLEVLAGEKVSLEEQLEAKQRVVEAALRFVRAASDPDRRAAIGAIHNAVADLHAYEDAVLIGHDRDAHDALGDAK